MTTARTHPNALLLMLASLVVLLVAACAPPQVDDPAEQAAATETPTAAEADSPGEDEGDEDGTPTEVIIASQAEPSTLASTHSESTQIGHAMRQVMEPLVDRHSETGELVGLLATDWEQVDDLTWRFHLREGVTFHDGSPFNAEAAAFGINWNYSHETGDGLRSWQGPEFEAVAVDELTLDIVLEGPDPILPRRMSLGTLPSMQHIEENGEEAWLAEPVGTGPYKFVEWRRGNSTTLERNEDWWGDDVSPEESDGEASIDKVTFLWRSDEQSMLNAVATGEAHYADGLPGELCLAELGDRCRQSEVSPNVTHLRPDHMNPVLGDLRVRRAMSHAVDRELIAEHLLPGTPAGMIVAPGTTGFVEELRPDPYDLELATSLIEEAKADGVPVDEHEFTMVYETGKLPGGEAYGQYVAAQLQEIGLNVTFRPMERTELFEGLVAPDPPPGPDRGWIAFHNHQNRLGDFQITLGSWYICGGNVSTSCNEEVDALYEAAVPIPEGQERHEALQEAARLVAEEYLIIPLVYEGRFVGVAEGLEAVSRVDTYIYAKHMKWEE